jgi:hypothetical protein
MGSSAGVEGISFPAFRRILGDSRGLTDVLSPLKKFRRFTFTFSKNCWRGGILRMETRAEWANRLGQGGFVFVFQTGPWVYRTTPRHRGVFEAKIFLLSTTYRMLPCHKAPTHTNYRIPSAVCFPFPGGGLGMARWCVPDAYLRDGK